MNITNEIVEAKARSLGFDLVGFAAVDVLYQESSHLEDWLSKGYQAGMSYMERNTGKRKDIRLVFPEAKSVISLALNYYTPAQHSIGQVNPPSSYEAKSSAEEYTAPQSSENHQTDHPHPPAGKLSRYAWGKDYHLVIWEKLKSLETQLKELDPDFRSLSYVDTGPVMDKAWAVRAGLGWQGKHTNIINPNLGSWFFIANIITNREFNSSQLITDHCGSCTACLDACPTQAITAEYIVDSNKCISYLTIENKGDIPLEFKGKFDGWIFGCDICQDVCPWNVKFSKVCNVDEFRPADGMVELPVKTVQEMNDASFKIRFAESPVKRAKLKGLKRNADFLSTEENP